MFQYPQRKNGGLNTSYFREIYENYRDEMFYAAYEILHNQQDAEDVIHETFVTLLECPGKIRKNSPQKNWNYILTILKNKSYNLIKRRKYHSDREFVIEMLEDVMDETVDGKFIQMEQKEFVMEALRQMNKTYRDILILQYYHEMSIVEIARLFGKTPDNIRHLSVRAKRKLKKLLLEAKNPGSCQSTKQKERKMVI